jgi:hypothetical protein
VRRTRHLSAEAARWVDTQTVQAATSLSWRSFLDRLDAKVAAADTALAAQRARAEQTSRFVRTSRADGFGMRMLVAKLAAKDAAWIEAMVTELARKLAALGDPDTAEARRANAFALLGHPLKVLQVLAAYDAAVADGRIQPVPATEADGVFEAAAEPPVPVDPLDPDAPAEPVDPDEQVAEAARAGNPILTGLPDPHAWLGWLAGLDWKRMLPQVLLYLHASHEAVAAGEGVARLEDADGPLGPVLLTQLAALFGPDTPVTVKPVLDLADVAPQDAYEARGRLREAVRLVHPHDAFPHAASTSPKLDLDHPIPYRPVRAGGPPGQTHLGNQAPLSRFHHRIKTHSAWQLRQPETGVYLWRSPHGYYFQTDQDGTHRLTAQAGQAYWNSTTPFGTRLTITYAELLADLKDTG